MEFNPQNQVIQYCVQSLVMDEKGHGEEATELARQAWMEATHDFEKFIAAWVVARAQQNSAEKIHWLEQALQHGRKADDNAVKTAFPAVHASLAACYRQMGDEAKARQQDDLAKTFTGKIYDTGPFYHGTKAQLQTGDLLTPGYKSNYDTELTMNHIYFTAIIHGAGLAAELSKGDGKPRVYRVTPTGSFENDPNVTDKKFPGNLTRSYRTTFPLKIIDEVTDWKKLSPEELQKWNEKLANNKGEIIN